MRLVLDAEAVILTGLSRGLSGALLAEAHVGSALFADAHPVAVAVESGGGVIQMADPGDLTRHAAPYRTVVIDPLARICAGFPR